jgi:TM2 domain-containing membrane protein YozV
MKNKTTSGLLALFLGWAGVHRFYLGQTGLGILYFFLMFFGVSFILGLIDAIVFFAMNDEEFDRKYNNPERQNTYERKKIYGPYSQGRGRVPAVPRHAATTRDVPNAWKVSGIKKYKEFDLDGAIEDFRKGLETHPRDISLHFNLACAYSLTEQIDKAYEHLDKAVGLGFNDFDKIRTHDDLAYVRIQDRFEDFQQNGYRLSPVKSTKVESEKEVIDENIQDDLLLSQLKRLSELRDRGLLSEQEFIIEKKKLTR